jgi:cell wall-associated NlpC family hydrolase
MAIIETLQNPLADTAELSAAYKTISALNLYDSPELTSLATQARAGLHLQVQRILDQPLDSIKALHASICEDDYFGWVDLADLDRIQTCVTPYGPPNPSLTEIQSQIPNVIAFAQEAMAQSNIYFWGGTVGPNYDCSGLVQHAFSDQGIWLPRDAYQQESFVQPIQNPGTCPEDLVSVLEPGDLIFFGTPLKATHVAIYLGKGIYIHSSGKDQGRNGIGIDELSLSGGQVSCNYYAQVRGAGRVVRSYQPGEKSWIETQETQI